MSKYTPDQLKSMAQEFINQAAQRDPRCEMLIMMLAMSTNITPEECLANITKLANGEPV